MHRLRSPIGLFLVAAFAGCRILDAERHTETVTTSAEFALIHFLHYPAFVGCSGRNDSVMAVTAAITLSSVWFMAELNVSGTGGKFISYRTRGSGMTLHTVGFHPESRFIVMAAAARLTLLHLDH